VGSYELVLNLLSLDDSLRCCSRSALCACEQQEYYSLQANCASRVRLAVRVVVILLIEQLGSHRADFRLFILGTLTQICRRRQLFI
jgi:hypothetical protein